MLTPDGQAVLNVASRIWLAKWHEGSVAAGIKRSDEEQDVVTAKTSEGMSDCVLLAAALLERVKWFHGYNYDIEDGTFNLDEPTTT